MEEEGNVHIAAAAAAGDDGIHAVLLVNAIDTVLE